MAVNESKWNIFTYSFTFRLIIHLFIYFCLPSTVRYKYHEGKDLTFLVTAVFQCIEWSLNHTKHSITVFPVNKWLNKWKQNLSPPNWVPGRCLKVFKVVSFKPVWIQCACTLVSGGVSVYGSNQYWLLRIMISGAQAWWRLKVIWLVQSYLPSPNHEQATLHWGW